MKPLRFIAEEVSVTFDEAPGLTKRPGCPDAFEWRGRTYRIVERLAEWHDYVRRGRMARNMRESHAAAAERRGSWGVGRDYYRVRADTGQVFEIYYDRAPAKSDDRKGHWFLFQELEPATEEPDTGGDR